MRLSCPVRKPVRVRPQDEPSVCSVGTDTYDCQGLESDCRSLAGPHAVAVGSNSCGCATGYDWNYASCDLNAGECRCVSESSSTCDSYTFDSTPGSFDDGSGSSNYRNNVDCAWKLRCPSGQSVRLSFSSFSTESGYDYVRVYDGESTSARHMGAFSGSSTPSTQTSSQRYMFIRFTTDGSSTGTGWAASWSCTSTSSSGASSSCASICNAHHCGTQCPICQGTGAGRVGNSCNGCGSSVQCSSSETTSSLSDEGDSYCRGLAGPRARGMGCDTTYSAGSAQRSCLCGCDYGYEWNYENCDLLGGRCTCVSAQPYGGPSAADVSLTTVIVVFCGCVGCVCGIIRLVLACLGGAASDEETKRAANNASSENVPNPLSGDGRL